MRWRSSPARTSWRDPAREPRRSGRFCATSPCWRSTRSASSAIRWSPWRPKTWTPPRRRSTWSRSSTKSCRRSSTPPQPSAPMRRSCMSRRSGAGRLSRTSSCTATPPPTRTSATTSVCAMATSTPAFARPTVFSRTRSRVQPIQHVPLETHALRRQHRRRLSHGRGPRPRRRTICARSSPRSSACHCRACG